MGNYPSLNTQSTVAMKPNILCTHNRIKRLFVSTRKQIKITILMDHQIMSEITWNEIKIRLRDIRWKSPKNL